MKPGNLLSQGAKSGGKRKMRIRYSAHRIFGVRFFILGAALKNPCQRSSGSFRPILHSESLEIHKVFLRLPLLDLYENLSPSAGQFFFRTGPGLLL